MERCSATEDLQAYENEQARLDALPEITKAEIEDKIDELLGDMDNIPDYLLNFIEESEDSVLQAVGDAVVADNAELIGKLVINHLIGLAYKGAIKEFNWD